MGTGRPAQVLGASAAAKASSAPSANKRARSTIALLYGAGRGPAPPAVAYNVPVSIFRVRSAALGIGGLAACIMLPAAAVDGAGAAGSTPPLFTAVYGLEWHGLTAGYSTLSLTEPSPGRYVYSSVSRARGVVRLVFPDPISERSTFR